MKKCLFLLIALTLSCFSFAQSDQNRGLNNKSKDFRLDFSLGQSYMTADDYRGKGVFQAEILMNYGFYQNEKLFLALGGGLQFFDLEVERAFSFPVYGSARYYFLKNIAFVDVKLGYSIGTEKSIDLVVENEPLPYGKITRDVSGLFLEGWVGGTFGHYDVGIGYCNNSVQYQETTLLSFETIDYSRDLHTVFLRISLHI